MGNDWSNPKDPLMDWQRMHNKFFDNWPAWTVSDKPRTLPQRGNDMEWAEYEPEEGKFFRNEKHLDDSNTVYFGRWDAYPPRLAPGADDH